MRLAIAVVLMLLGVGSIRAAETVRVYPAPDGEPISKRFTVAVEGQNAPVYVAKVCSLTAEKPDVYLNGEAGFASFDIQGSVTVTVTTPEAIKSVKLLPSSYGLAPQISGNRVSFTVSKPGQIVVDINGDWNNSLQLFANPFETDPPNLKDPNLIYFGPGLHAIAPMKVGPGKTVYIAGGAVVYGKLPENNQANDNPHSGALISLTGPNTTIRGRGIIDGSLIPAHKMFLVLMHGDNMKVEGVVLRDSGSFNLVSSDSNRIDIANVKIFGRLLNSDGMDIINSQKVHVSDSFVRTFDDLVVLKTARKGGQQTRDVTVERMVLWNEKAHALTVGSEIREDVDNVLFTDCDIVHDKGHDWLFRVLLGDAGTVKHVTWENMRVEEDRRLFSLEILKNIYSKDSDRGHIQDLVFRNISAPKPEWNHGTQLNGFDAAHGADGVLFENVTIGGKPFKSGDVEQNAFVKNVTVKP